MKFFKNKNSKIAVLLTITILFMTIFTSFYMGIKVSASPVVAPFIYELMAAILAMLGISVVAGETDTFDSSGNMYNVVDSYLGDPGNHSNFNMIKMLLTSAGIITLTEVNRLTKGELLQRYIDNYAEVNSITNKNVIVFEDAEKKNILMKDVLSDIRQKEIVTKNDFIEDSLIYDGSSYQNWVNYPDSPDTILDYPYQLIMNINHLNGNDVTIYYEPNKSVRLKDLYTIEQGWQSSYDYTLLLESKEKYWIDKTGSTEALQSGIKETLEYGLFVDGIWEKVNTPPSNIWKQSTFPNFRIDAEQYRMFATAENGKFYKNSSGYITSTKNFAYYYFYNGNWSLERTFSAMESYTSTIDYYVLGNVNTYIERNSETVLQEKNVVLGGREQYKMYRLDTEGNWVPFSYNGDIDKILELTYNAEDRNINNVRYLETNTDIYNQFEGIEGNDIDIPKGISIGGGEDRTLPVILEIPENNPFTETKPDFWEDTSSSISVPNSDSIDDFINNALTNEEKQDILTNNDEIVLDNDVTDVIDYNPPYDDTQVVSGLGVISQWLNMIWERIGEAIGIMSQSTTADPNDPDITEKSKDYKWPDLFLCIWQVLVSCIKLILRAGVFLLSIFNTEADGSMLNSTVKQGLQFLKNQTLPVPFNVSFWNAFSAVMTLFISTLILKKANRFV